MSGKGQFSFLQGWLKQLEAAERAEFDTPERELWARFRWLITTALDEIEELDEVPGTDADDVLGRLDTDSGGGGDALPRGPAPRSAAPRLDHGMDRPVGDVGGPRCLRRGPVVRTPGGS